MLKVCVLGSGSGGNCTAVWTGTTRVLVDAGGGLRPGYIREHLERLSLARVDAILVTHAHGDHINRTTVELCRELEIPVYCNRATWKVAKGKVPDLSCLEAAEPKLVRFFGDACFEVGDLAVKPFSVPHEGCGQHYGSRVNDHTGNPVGFVISHTHRGRAYGIGYATDLGCVPDRVVDHLADVDVLVLESNHCEHLVEEVGAYHGPWVLSDVGHLSNCDAGEAIVKVMGRRPNGPKPLCVFLAHISQDHNTEARALRQVGRKLKDGGVELAGLHLTYQDRRSVVVEVG
jgi:phosphoribosyl 1,2-cyclic phosphodiesterase